MLPSQHAGWYRFIQSFFKIFSGPQMSIVTTVVFFSLAVFPLTTFAAPPNWSGPYTPCRRHADLLSHGHMELGVRIATSNAALARQFEEAMDFWAQVLDIDWHETDSDDCAIELVDGTPALFDIAGDCGCAIARAQYPDRADFEGWIAFNPEPKFTRQEMFRNSVHELGHLFGLGHNPDSSSVMFFSDFDQLVSLDSADLAALAARHKLRANVARTGVTTVYVMAAPAAGE